MRRSALDSWLFSSLSSSDEPWKVRIEAHQGMLLKQLIGYLKKNSPFYKEKLKDFSPQLFDSPSQLSKLNFFTTATDIVDYGDSMICVAGRDISRVVSMFTSGTTSKPKRIYFTDDDLEETIVFFMHGMSEMVEKGQKAMILMNCAQTASIGDLLRIALERLGVGVISHGAANDIYFAVKKARQTKPDCIVGIPNQVLQMARIAPDIRPKTVLLSADYIPQSVITALKSEWDCDVFSHYGMTETGLGGGVDCSAHSGYHTRAWELLFEIIDPVSGVTLPPNMWGEVVVTTLTRTGMPLLRYRTGDISRIISEPCPCGSPFLRLDRIRGRVSNEILLPQGERFSIHQLDEILFSIPNLLDYTASLTEDFHLNIFIKVQNKEGISLAMKQAVKKCPSQLIIDWQYGDGFFSTGTQKRKIIRISTCKENIHGN